MDLPHPARCQPDPGTRSRHPPRSPDTASRASPTEPAPRQFKTFINFAWPARPKSPGFASVTKSKQSLILQQLLDRYHYPDTRIGQELREGFPLTGWLQPSGIWPTLPQPPTLTVDQLLTNAHAITGASLRKVQAAPMDDNKDAIWQATQDEVANGWLRMQPVQPAPHPQPVVSTRFGVVQKNKIRPIDNFRASHVNAACGTSEKVLVDGPDLIAQACLKLLALAAPSKGKDRLVGRTWDLKSAYKQLAVRADHSRFAWIAVQDPTTHSLHLAQMHSMPFGAVASALLRCSEALKFLGRRHLLLVITSYFDDFTVLTWKTAAPHTTLVVEAYGVGSETRGEEKQPLLRSF